MADTNYQRLRRVLDEVFMLDHADLDFGIYRIMNVKRDEITRFLDNDLLPQVKATLAGVDDGQRTQIKKELDELEEGIRKGGMNPDDSPKVQDLRAKYKAGVDLEALENEVYSRLADFFRRYYSEGDFLSLRRYKEGVYAIPYEGEEVKLHWANADQYYIKSSEQFRDYVFKLPDDRRVHFKLAATGTETDNNKAPAGKERRFILCAEDAVAEQDGELVIRFEYRFDPESRKREVLNTEAEKAILGSAPDAWRSALAAKAPTEKNSDRTLIAKHLNDYTAKNTFDYFIHKDLGGFLRRELDFYIKNEVMHLDDIENETAARVHQYLSKVKAIRLIAQKIIDFLVQLEEFQKKLWLKKKFVMETNYCITLDRVPEGLYRDIAANDAQREEWVRLFSINDISGDLTNPGYGEPLSIEFLKAHQHLVVDTAHFDEAFKTHLLAEIENIDEATDGVLIRSENFQALSLLSERYKKQIACLYIDPPYNTGDSEILYKNEYISASWLTLMENRLALATHAFLSDDPVLFIAIDDFEMVDLCELIDTHFPSLRREMIVVNHHPQGGKAKTLASTHEYMLACVARGSDRTLRGRLSKDGVEQRPFKRSGTAESNFRRARPNSFYAILVEPTTREVVGAERPPALGVEYPREPTKEGYLRIYPIGGQNEERVWRRSYESGLALIAARKLICTENGTVYQLIEAEERTPALFTNWVGSRYNAGTFGANLLGEIIGEHNPFSYPKSIHTVEDAIFSADLEEGSVCLDFFAGSGTTGHAVINLNRSDGDRRKYVLVEMGDYFDTVLLPRIKKVVYSRDWRAGRPVSREGTSHMFKYMRLESYEDTLNNLQLSRTGPQQSLLEEHPNVREDYVLRYMLDVEAKESLSVLDAEHFGGPFNHRLDIATGVSGETKSVIVDLPETFNYLIGLHVKTVDEVRGIRVVTGMNPRGERVLILWRNTKETDNDALDEWFRKQGYNAKDQEYEIIYVNGDNHLENLRRDDHTWKIRITEAEFKRLMFDSVVDQS